MCRQPTPKAEVHEPALMAGVNQWAAVVAGAFEREVFGDEH